MSPRRRTWAAVVAGGAALIALSAAFVARQTAGPASATAEVDPRDAPPDAPARFAATQPSPRARQAVASAQALAGDAGAMAGAQGEDARAQAEARLARAKDKLERYREATRYPPGSRPAAEEPDRLRLHEQAERTQPLTQDSPTQVTVGQDRTFVTADETARLWVRCATESGASVACRVSNAQVSVVNEDGAPPVDRRAPLAFRDDGTLGDATADDGTSTALLQPQALHLGDVSGTLRVDLEVTDSRDVGHPFFTLVTTGAPPATLTGEVTDALLGGSLAFGVGIQVQTAGQYVLHGRVDDAKGQPVAYLEFNDALPAGATQVPLLLFGKLIRDQHPAFPLTLRDVDGFLLLPDTFPDRRVLASLEGPLHQTARYREEQFSDAEWTSEQKTRYLQRFQQDVDQAQAAVDGAP